MAHTETDAWLALSLASYLNLLPLSRQLSCLSGSLWSRTLQARARCKSEHTYTQIGGYSLWALLRACYRSAGRVAHCVGSPSELPHLAGSLWPCTPREDAIAHCGWR